TVSSDFAKRGLNFIRAHSRLKLNGSAFVQGASLFRRRIFVTVSPGDLSQIEATDCLSWECTFPRRPRWEWHATMTKPTLPLFEEHRQLLFGIAYRMLGTVMDAQDMVQDTYVRWQQTSVEEIRSPRAWLTTVITRRLLP